MNPQPKPQKIETHKQERRKMKPIAVVADVLLNSTIGERERERERERVIWKLWAYVCFEPWVNIS